MLPPDYQTLEAFVQSVRVLEPDAAWDLRAQFLKTFVPFEKWSELQSSPASRDEYFMYLWDFIARPWDPITESDQWSRVSEIEGEVFLMWDLHGPDRVEIDDYFKFPMGTVLSATAETFRRGEAYLPEDLYLFDASFRWAAVFTHEWRGPGESQIRECSWVTR